MSRQVYPLDGNQSNRLGTYDSHLPTVKFHVKGSYAHKSKRMSADDSAPPHLLMQNVRDIRKRLLETEKTLNTLTKAEARLDDE